MTRRTAGIGQTRLICIITPWEKAKPPIAEFVGLARYKTHNRIAEDYNEWGIEDLRKGKELAEFMKNKMDATIIRNEDDLGKFVEQDEQFNALDWK